MTAAEAAVIAPPRPPTRTEHPVRLAPIAATTAALLLASSALKRRTAHRERAAKTLTALPPAAPAPSTGIERSNERMRALALTAIGAVTATALLLYGGTLLLATPPTSDRWGLYVSLACVTGPLVGYACLTAHTNLARRADRALPQHMVTAFGTRYVSTTERTALRTAAAIIGTLAAIYVLASMTVGVLGIFILYAALGVAG